MKEEFDITSEIDDVLDRKTADVKVAEVKKEEKEEELDQSPMAKLLRKNPIKTPVEGEKIEGKVIGADSKAVYLDLEVFGAGIVYGKEVRDGFGANRKKLSIGDTVTAVILDLENEDGYV